MQTQLADWIRDTPAGVEADSILRAASEVQMLAMAIAAKHLAKAEAARRMSGEPSWPEPEPGG